MYKPTLSKNAAISTIIVVVMGLFLNILLGFNVKAALGETLPPVPAGLKSHFALGLSSQPGATGWMKESGAAWDIRYQYLAGGVNTPGNWKTWQDPALPAGQFALDYLNESYETGYLPVLTWYQILQSSPAIGADEAGKDYSNLNNPGTMNSYFADFKLLMDKAKIFGKTVIVHIEPDLWGFLQKQSTNPANLTAAVASSGNSDLINYSDTVSGFARALIGLRDKYAPNVLLAYHISPWSSSYGDLGTNTDPDFNVEGAYKETGAFYNQLNANFDLLFYDIADRDAALYSSWGSPNHWWDVNNQVYPNFNRFNQFAAGITSVTGKRGMLWQVPIGNTLFESLNNTHQHWQDNRVQYYLGGGTNQHLQDLANSGIMGILFGAGDNNSTNYNDAAADGITNPAPFNGNSRVSEFSDDDGGYLRLQAREYYNRGTVTLQVVETAPAATVPAGPVNTVPSAAWQLVSTLNSASNSQTIVSQFNAPSNASGSYILDIEVYDVATGTKIAQWHPTQALTPGQILTLENHLQLAPGSYIVKQGVFNPDWSLISWQDGPTFQVN